MPKIDTRIVFMGSPKFALPTLQALDKHWNLVGVITQPDRPAGRKRNLKPPPVKELALDMGIPIQQPRSLKQTQSIEELRTWEPDLIVVAAFGQILPPKVLELPHFGCINVHASLLPRWRGAAPVRAAILHGDAETGVTIMKMDTGVDTGPMISQSKTPIYPEDSTISLSTRLAEIGAELLIETLPGYIKGDIKLQPQDESQATYAPMLKKSDGMLDFKKPAQEIARMVRAFFPWPGTFTHWNGKLLKIHKAHALDIPSPGIGVRIVHQDQPAIGTLKGVIILDEVQPAGKKVMPSTAFLRGAKDWINS